MQLIHNYYYFTKAISKENCQKILSIGRNKVLNEGTIYEENKPTVDKTRRDCKVAWVHEPWIYELLNPYIKEANEKANWNFQWDWNQDMQFTSYNKDHYFGWHSDQGPKPFVSNNKNFNGKIRKISLTLQLTDPSKYEGGDFQFKWFSKQGVEDIKTVKEAKELGTLIIFPSFIWHQVTPITKGKRESLVNWSVGNLFI
nr:2OG-Fe(II) oxygenase [uncultured Mediterranean phage uvMED]